MTKKDKAVEQIINWFKSSNSGAFIRYSMGDVDEAVMRVIAKEALRLGREQVDKKYNDLHNDFIKISELCEKAQNEVRELKQRIKKEPRKA